MEAILQIPGTSAATKLWVWHNKKALLVPLLAVMTSIAYLATAAIVGHISISTLLWRVCAVGAVASCVSIILPDWRERIAYALVPTAVIFFVMRLSYPWLTLLHNLPLSAATRYWLVDGPGSGLLGFLPATLLVLLLGRSGFRLSITEQWAGKTTITWTAAWYGGGVGLVLAVLTIGLALMLGGATIGWQPFWSSYTVNLVSNLYEEVLARGMLLQIIRRRWNDRAAMIWTGVVFGLMHGLNEKAMFIALISWAIAWAVLRARSLWAGWVAHQVMDVVVDSLLQ
jgi:membrane protease YdiL (CAAX protease family)